MPYNIILLYQHKYSCFIIIVIITNVCYIVCLFNIMYIIGIVSRRIVCIYVFCSHSRTHIIRDRLSINDKNVKIV